MPSPLTGVPRRRELHRPAPTARALYLTAYAPRVRDGERVLLCPPLGEEHSLARGALHRLAARLSGAGHSVVVYDPRGHGDSEGDFDEVTLETLTEDLAVAASHPSLAPGPTAVIAARFGALVAAAAIRIRRPRPARLLLVSPVLVGESYARDLLRKHVDTQMAALGATRLGVDDLHAALVAGGTVDSDGHPLTGALYSQMRGVDGVALLAGDAASEVSVEVIMMRSGLRERTSREILELSGRRPVVVRSVEELEPWRAHRLHIVMDAPRLAADLIGSLDHGVAA